MNLERKVAALERELMLLRQMVTSGPGATTQYGASYVRPYQVGFPAKLTSSYDATNGYTWSRRILTATGPIQDEGNPLTGTHAWDAGGRTDLTSGQVVWMEPHAAAQGYIFTISSPTGAAGSAYNRVQEEGSNLTQRTTLNFIGATVTAADDAGNSRTNVTITAGTGIDNAADQVTLGSGYTVTATLASVGFPSLTLPGLGTYLLHATLLGETNVSAFNGAPEAAYLYGQIMINGTTQAGAEVRWCHAQVTGTTVQHSVCVTTRYVTTAADSVSFWAARGNNTPTWTTSQIPSPYATLGYVMLT